MYEKARETVLRHDMLRRGDTILAAVSGGADSVAMLHFLLRLRHELSFCVAAMHLNHGLRGEESDRDEGFVRELCERLGVELAAEAANVREIAVKNGLSLEEAGREARYAFFARCSKNASAGRFAAGGRRRETPLSAPFAQALTETASFTRDAVKIATAHTINDSVETAILNLARGTALRGLCGIPPVRGNIIRPLIDCTRGEIEEYCAINGLDFVTDSTNASDDFARNRIRRHILPALTEINPKLLDTVGTNLEVLRADADYLDKLASEAAARLSRGENMFDRSGYLELERPVRMRVLISGLSASKIPADSARLARLDAIAAAGCGAEQLTDGLYFKSDKSVFGFFPPEPDAPEAIPDMLPEIPELFRTVCADVYSHKKLLLTCTDYEHYEESIKYEPKVLKNALDCDKIDRTLICGSRRESDSVRIKGRGCTKTLKKLFSEAKIPRESRGRILVLRDSKGPVWIEGFGAAERAAVCETSGRILILDVQNGVDCK